MRPQSLIPKRWILIVIFLTGMISSAAWGQIATDSLRAELTGDAVRLTWGAGTGPYGIYRAADPSGLDSADNYVGVTGETFFLDALDLEPGDPVLYFLVADPPRCNQHFICSNGNPCDGVETCFDRRCIAGEPVNCNDGDSCTEDSCSLSTGACSSTALDCEDGDPCTLDYCTQGLGCESSVDPAAGVGVAAELAGNPLGAYPHFEFVRSFNEDAPVSLAVDPGRTPDLVGETCDVYVVEARSAAGWCSDRTLSDARGAPDTRTFVAGQVQDNTFPLVPPLALDSSAGHGIGHGYDVVLDCDQDGQLDGAELVDGLEDRSGLYLVHDLTQPGPLATVQFDSIGPEPDHCDSFINPGNDDMRIYHPAELQNPGFGGRFPLVVISHGNGHCFDWYDFLGNHLASYGYIVMSHDNNTGPGIETASVTTLTFTDRILLEQDSLGGGVLLGHIDSSRIAWLGHSRGGEGIVRAYDRIVDDGYVPQAYTADDIVVLSSIAPTDFLERAGADPHDANFHLLYGAADGDVCGCPNSLYPFALLERATGNRHSTYLHGADHNDFNCCGFNDFEGPAGTAIGRAEAQQVQKAIQLATVERYAEGSLAAEDFFWRQWESFRPIGVDPSTVVVSEYRKEPAQRSFVLEDYQTEPSTTVSSSGGGVNFSVLGLTEAQLNDTNGSFSWTGTEPMNGMTRGEVSDDTRGAVFDYAAGGDSFYELEVVPVEQDFSDDRFLSFRFVQGTRHPLTAAELGDLNLTVSLVDGVGGASAIRIDTYGGGVEEPYQRGNYGSGAGWQNEFETVRIRITDFLANGSDLDLSNIRFVRFDFGSSYGSAQGRLGLDDVELTEE
ncbi:MAG: hypothetical protein IFK94_09760 [Acidobacteria bacterium]|uniref:Alpha/beta hydrolase family protein n=1 Tax=Candidatus Polarisedimenticola svalbardensis TaxID=2886004 RepID=A0A8J7CLQ0_9BACT|nr:hypothetical protein [Candidatus Polarisedimenticola svalbardensis]